MVNTCLSDYSKNEATLTYSTLSHDEVDESCQIEQCRCIGETGTKPKSRTSDTLEYEEYVTVGYWHTETPGQDTAKPDVF